MELRHLRYFVATVEWKSLGEKRRAESMSRNLQSVRRYRILRLSRAENGRGHYASKER